MDTLVLFAHGSRDPGWRVPFDRLAERVRAMRPETRVAVAFLEHAVPSLTDAVDAAAAAGAKSVMVVPLFLGVGGHLRKDLPALVGALRTRHPALEVATAPSLGESPEVMEAVAAWLAGLP